jgi:hypothetical protein
MKRRNQRDLQFVIVASTLLSVIGVGAILLKDRQHVPLVTICPVSDVPQLKAAPQPVAEAAPTPSPKIHFVLVK